MRVSLRILHLLLLIPLINSTSLTGVTIEQGQINPEFSPSITSYFVYFHPSTTVVTLHATASPANSVFLLDKSSGQFFTAFLDTVQFAVSDLVDDEFRIFDTTDDSLFTFILIYTMPPTQAPSGSSLAPTNNPVMFDRSRSLCRNVTVGSLSLPLGSAPQSRETITELDFVVLLDTSNAVSLSEFVLLKVMLAAAVDNVFPKYESARFGITLFSEGAEAKISLTEYYTDLGEDINSLTKVYGSSSDAYTGFEVAASEIWDLPLANSRKKIMFVILSTMWEDSESPCECINKYHQSGIGVLVLAVGEVAAYLNGENCFNDNVPVQTFASAFVLAVGLEDTLETAISTLGQSPYDGKYTWNGRAQNGEPVFESFLNNWTLLYDQGWKFVDDDGNLEDMPTTSDSGFLLCADSNPTMVDFTYGATSIAYSTVLFNWELNSMITGTPTKSPSGGPSRTPSIAPGLPPTTNHPSIIPSVYPSSSIPSEIPSLTPLSSQPTVFPTSNSPSKLPSRAPSTEEPSNLPSRSPSPNLPTLSPSSDSPTKSPSFAPSTEDPSSTPSIDPSLTPSCVPSGFPTSDEPSFSPSCSPTSDQPSQNPSSCPTTDAPSRIPSGSPSKTPSRCPSTGPTFNPTSDAPSFLPTLFPTSEKPSQSPSCSPTPDSPSTTPSKSPSEHPTSDMPSISPTYFPTSDTPSKTPSLSPTSDAPSVMPSRSPSEVPTSDSPSQEPSRCPSTGPTCNPSSDMPTVLPSHFPTSDEPSKTPSFFPSSDAPSKFPTRCPTTSPSTNPTSSPSSSPTMSPSTMPTTLPSSEPSTSPSSSPTTTPTTPPSRSPTTSPSSEPSVSPTSPPSTSPTTEPSSAPSSSPSSMPSASPSTSPTTSPTSDPSSFPTESPTSSPSSEPSNSPSTSPTTEPSSSPSSSPTSMPSASPSTLPTTSPTSDPSSLPTESPTSSPSSEPSNSPSTSPSSSPTSIPSASPSTAPTTSPTSDPSSLPTESPSSPPSTSPTTEPSSSPSSSPSSMPSASPSTSPTTSPTSDPSSFPTESPTSSPSSEPSNSPSTSPSSSPTSIPSASPSTEPTTSPTSDPSSLPTESPTSSPSSEPSNSPTTSPTTEPSSAPSSSPTSMPSASPSTSPTTSPTSDPSSFPTESPTSSPSSEPSNSPSSDPTTSPTTSPTSDPTSSPSTAPTTLPTSSPSTQPSSSPTSTPTSTPSTSPTSSPSTSPSTSPTTLPSVAPTVMPSVSPTWLNLAEDCRCLSFDCGPTQWSGNYTLQIDENVTQLYRGESYHWENDLFQLRFAHIDHPMIIDDHWIFSSVDPDNDIILVSQTAFGRPFMRYDDIDPYPVSGLSWIVANSWNILSGGVCQESYCSSEECPVDPTPDVLVDIFPTGFPSVEPSLSPTRDVSVRCQCLTFSCGGLQWDGNYQFRYMNGTDEYYFEHYLDYFGMYTIEKKVITGYSPFFGSDPQWVITNPDNLVLLVSADAGDSQTPLNQTSWRSFHPQTGFIGQNFLCPQGSVICDDHQCPTHSPTTSPSSEPTSNPTTSPSTSPTTDPSTFPSSSPTTSPTPGPATSPSSAPSTSPSSEPSTSPSTSPTTLPSTHPTTEPSTSPTSSPSTYPSTSPTSLPSSEPTSSPSTAPTSDPSTSPSTSPTSSPSTAPSTAPTTEPSSGPSTSPSTYPTSSPSTMPSDSPTSAPSSIPSESPTTSPSSSPTSQPSTFPSSSPTSQPTSFPSSAPTTSPTTSPSTMPSQSPSSAPSSSPSSSPTSQPSISPTTFPTTSPSSEPTSVPSDSPTTSPSSIPSTSPTSSPSTVPTNSPTTSPSSTPSESPTTSPSTYPTASPSTFPSSSPSTSPSTSPTSEPSTSPSSSPTSSPSSLPTISPTTSPSTAPTSKPSESPTTPPTTMPTTTPSVSPTNYPSTDPSYSPSATPSNFPSIFPTTTVPSTSPSTKPSSTPSNLPSRSPSKCPSTSPSKNPTFTPTSTSPSTNPSVNPSKHPSTDPTRNPSSSPSRAPSTEPSSNPTSTMPSRSPSNIPTNTPTWKPSSTPSVDPTTYPSQTPSAYPTTTLPSVSPSREPTVSDPSTTPSVRPSVNPSSQPSACPTSTLPSISPSQCPTTTLPSITPSGTPSSTPSTDPTMSPTFASPSVSPSQHPLTTFPSKSPSNSPSLSPTISNPTTIPTNSPSFFPSPKPTTESTLSPSMPPTFTYAPSSSPSYTCGQQIDGVIIDEKYGREITYETLDDGTPAAVLDFKGDILYSCEKIDAKCDPVIIRNVTIRCMDETKTGPFLEAVNATLILDRVTIIATGQSCLTGTDATIELQETTMERCGESTFDDTMVIATGSTLDGAMVFNGGGLSVEDTELDSGSSLEVSGSGDETISFSDIDFSGLGRRNLQASEDYALKVSNVKEILLVDIVVDGLQKPLVYGENVTNVTISRVNMTSSTPQLTFKSIRGGIEMVNVGFSDISGLYVLSCDDVRKLRAVYITMQSIQTSESVMHFKKSSVEMIGFTLEADVQTCLTGDDSSVSISDTSATGCRVLVSATDTTVLIDNLEVTGMGAIELVGDGSEDFEMQKSVFTNNLSPQRRFLQDSSYVISVSNFATATILSTSFTDYDSQALISMNEVSSLDISSVDVLSCVSTFALRQIQTASLTSIRFNNIAGDYVLQIENVDDLTASKIALDVIKVVDSSFKITESTTRFHAVNASLTTGTTLSKFMRATNSEITLSNSSITTDVEEAFKVLGGRFIGENSDIYQLATLNDVWPFQFMDQAEVAFYDFSVYCSDHDTSCYVTTGFLEKTYQCFMCGLNEGSLSPPVFVDASVSGGSCSQAAAGQTRNNYYLSVIQGAEAPNTCGRMEFYESSEQILCPPGYCEDGCAPGREGLLCGNCKEGLGQGLSHGDCHEECDHMATFVVIGILYCFVIAAFFLFMSPKPDFTLILHAIYVFQISTFLFHQYFPSLQNLLPVFMFFRFDWISAYRFRGHSLCITENLDAIHIRYISNMFICVTPILIYVLYLRYQDNRWVSNKSLQYVYFQYAVAVFPIILSNVIEASNCIEIEGQKRLWWNTDRECGRDVITWEFMALDFPFIVAALTIGFHCIRPMFNVRENVIRVLRKSYPSITYWIMLFLLRVLIILLVVPHYTRNIAFGVMLLLFFIFLGLCIEIILCWDYSILAGVIAEGLVHGKNLSELTETDGSDFEHAFEEAEMVSNSSVVISNDSFFSYFTTNRPATLLVHLDYYHLFWALSLSFLSLCSAMFNQMMHDQKEPTESLYDFQATMMIVLLFTALAAFCHWLAHYMADCNCGAMKAGRRLKMKEDGYGGAQVTSEDTDMDVDGYGGAQYNDEEDTHSTATTVEPIIIGGMPLTSTLAGNSDSSSLKILTDMSTPGISIGVAGDLLSMKVGEITPSLLANPPPRNVDGLAAALFRKVDTPQTLQPETKYDREDTERRQWLETLDEHVILADVEEMSNPSVPSWKMMQDGSDMMMTASRLDYHIPDMSRSRDPISDRDIITIPPHKRWTASKSNGTNYEDFADDDFIPLVSAEKPDHLNYIDSPYELEDVEVQIPSLRMFDSDEFMFDTLRNPSSAIADDEREFILGMLNRRSASGGAAFDPGSDTFEMNMKILTSNDLPPIPDPLSTIETSTGMADLPEIPSSLPPVPNTVESITDDLVGKVDTMKSSDVDPYDVDYQVFYESTRSGAVSGDYKPEARYTDSQDLGQKVTLGALFDDEPEYTDPTPLGDIDEFIPVSSSGRGSALRESVQESISLPPESSEKIEEINDQIDMGFSDRPVSDVDTLDRLLADLADMTEDLEANTEGFSKLFDGSVSTPMGSPVETKRFIQEIVGSPNSHAEMLTIPEIGAPTRMSPEVKRFINSSTSAISPKQLTPSESAPSSPLDVENFLIKPDSLTPKAFIPSSQSIREVRLEGDGTSNLPPSNVNIPTLTTVQESETESDQGVVNLTSSDIDSSEVLNATADKEGNETSNADTRMRAMDLNMVETDDPRQQPMPGFIDSSKSGFYEDIAQMEGTPSEPHGFIVVAHPRQVTQDLEDTGSLADFSSDLGDSDRGTRKSMGTFGSFGGISFDEFNQKRKHLSSDLFSEPEPGSPAAANLPTSSKLDMTHRRKVRGKVNLAEAPEHDGGRHIVHKHDPLHHAVEDDGDPHIDDLNMYALSKPDPVEESLQTEKSLSRRLLKSREQPGSITNSELEMRWTKWLEAKKEKGEGKSFSEYVQNKRVSQKSSGPEHRPNLSSIFSNLDNTEGELSEEVSPPPKRKAEERVGKQSPKHKKRKKRIPSPPRKRLPTFNPPTPPKYPKKSAKNNKLQDLARHTYLEASSDKALSISGKVEESDDFDAADPVYKDTTSDRDDTTSTDEWPDTMQGKRLTSKMVWVVVDDENEAEQQVEDSSSDFPVLSPPKIRIPESPMEKSEDITSEPMLESESSTFHIRAKQFAPRFHPRRTLVNNFIQTERERQNEINMLIQESLQESSVEENPVKPMESLRSLASDSDPSFAIHESDQPVLAPSSVRSTLLSGMSEDLEKGIDILKSSTYARPATDDTIAERNKLLNQKVMTENISFGEMPIPPRINTRLPGRGVAYDSTSSEEEDDFFSEHELAASRSISRERSRSNSGGNDAKFDMNKSMIVGHLPASSLHKKDDRNFRAPSLPKGANVGAIGESIILEHRPALDLMTMKSQTTMTTLTTSDGLDNEPLSDRSSPIGTVGLNSMGDLIPDETFHDLQDEYPESDYEEYDDDRRMTETTMNSIDQTTDTYNDGTVGTMASIGTYNDGTMTSMGTYYDGTGTMPSVGYDRTMVSIGTFNPDATRTSIMTIPEETSDPHASVADLEYVTKNPDSEFLSTSGGTEFNEEAAAEDISDSSTETYDSKPSRLSLDEFELEFPARPLGLRVRPADNGKGVVVSSIKNKSLKNTMLEIGCRILAVNGVSVEHITYEEFMRIIQAAALPVNLQFRLPGIDPKRSQDIAVDDEKAEFKEMCKVLSDYVNGDESGLLLELLTDVFGQKFQTLRLIKEHSETVSPKQIAEYFTDNTGQPEVEFLNQVMTTVNQYEPHKQNTEEAGFREIFAGSVPVSPRGGTMDEQAEDVEHEHIET